MSIPLRPLGKTGLDVSAIGFGSFKIGRNTGIKYPSAYDLPDDSECRKLLDGVLELGINLIDTAPAYGIAEERLGQLISHRRDEIVVSSKVGERFEDGESNYDFRPEAVKESVEASLKKLNTGRLDLLLIHSGGDDLEIQRSLGTVGAIQELKQRGLVRAIGFSGKTVEGAREALDWADCLMVEYHVRDESHAEVIREAHLRGIGVLVKKGLASGHLPPEEAISFVMSNPDVDSLVLGGLNLAHFRANCEIAMRVRSSVSVESE